MKMAGKKTAGRKTGQKPTRRNYNILFQDELYEKVQRVSAKSRQGQAEFWTNVATAFLRDTPDATLMAMALNEAHQKEVERVQKKFEAKLARLHKKAASTK